MQALSELPELTLSEQSLLENLIKQAESYIMSERLTGYDVDDGFHYDYGDITNAWHSVPSVEFSPEEWGYIELDVGQVRDYILDHLAEWASDFWPVIDYDTYGRGCDEPMTRRINVKWYWERNRGKTYLVCELPA